LSAYAERVHQVLAFLGVSTLVIITPGPDTAVTIRSALFGRRRGGVFTAAGVATGQLVWALATAAGVAALLAQSRLAFDTIRLVGAAYLLYLGPRSLYSASRKGKAAHLAAIGTGPRRGWAAYRQGLLSDLGNPKMAVFFTSLLPQFTGADGARFIPLLLLGVIFSVMTFIWLAGYAVAIGKTGDFLRRVSVRRILDGVAGAVLVGLGVRIAAEAA